MLQRVHNLTQPAWVDEMWNGTSAYNLILEMKRITRIADFNSPRKSKILGGYLLADFVQRMQQKAAGTLKSPEKMVLYSAVGIRCSFASFMQTALVPSSTTAL